MTSHGDTAALRAARPIRRAAPADAAPGVIAVLGAAALLAISTVPLWATSIRDVVGNGFARIIYEAPAWSVVVAPWMPVGVVLTALAGCAAALWLVGGAWRARGAFLTAWVGLSLLGALALAAALLPGVLDSYRGPNGFHEMHLRPLYFVGVLLAVAVLASALATLRARPTRDEPA